MVFTPLLRNRPYTEYCDSTEDMLRSVQSTNEKLELDPDANNDRLSVMSMDAEALFPLLALEDIMQGIWRLIMESHFTYKNIDYREMALYIAVMYKREKLVKQHIVSHIPVRQVTLDGTERGEPTLSYLDNPKYTRDING